MTKALKRKAADKMAEEQLAVYAKEKMYQAIGSVMAQSTVALTLNEVLDLLGVYELVNEVNREERY